MKVDVGMEEFEPPLRITSFNRAEELVFVYRVGSRLMRV
jgi:hypothetical protein